MLRSALIALAVIGLAGPADADCVADLKSVLMKSHNSGPYVVQLVSDDMTMTTEIVPPTDIHATVVIDGATQEVTVIAGKGWMRTNGTWTLMSDAVATQMAGDISQAVRVLDQIGTTTCLGSQSFEGNEYSTFRYDVAIKGPGTSATIYVDPATNLPAIMLVTEVAGGRADNTRATYRYDPSVTVSAPM